MIALVISPFATPSSGRMLLLVVVAVYTRLDGHGERASSTALHAYADAGRIVAQDQPYVRCGRGTVRVSTVEYSCDARFWTGSQNAARRWARACNAAVGPPASCCYCSCCPEESFITLQSAGFWQWLPTRPLPGPPGPTRARCETPSETPAFTVTFNQPWSTGITTVSTQPGDPLHLARRPN